MGFRHAWFSSLSLPDYHCLTGRHAPQLQLYQPPAYNDPLEWGPSHDCHGCSVEICYQSAYSDMNQSARTPHCKEIEKLNWTRVALCVFSRETLAMISDKQDRSNVAAAICLCKSHGRSAHSREGSAKYLHHGILQGKLCICHITFRISLVGYITGNQRKR